MRRTTITDMFLGSHLSDLRYLVAGNVVPGYVCLFTRGLGTTAAHVVDELDMA